MGVGVLVWPATEWAGLHHVYEAGLQLKVHVPTSTLGPVATLAVEGMEKSRRVFSAMGSIVVDGA